MKKILLSALLLVPFVSATKPDHMAVLEYNNDRAYLVTCVAGYVFVQNSMFKRGRTYQAEADSNFVQLMKASTQGSQPMTCDEYNKIRLFGDS